MEIKSKNNQEIKQKMRVCLDAFLCQQNYAEKSNLGSGNYAEVFKVTTKNEKTVALKVIDLIRSTSYRNRFLNTETKILLEIKHPDIIKIYQIIQFRTFLFVVVEFAPYDADDGAMADILNKNGAFKKRLGQNVFKQMANGKWQMANGKWPWV